MPYCNQCGTEYQFGMGKCANCGSDLPKPAEHPKTVTEGEMALGTSRQRRFAAGLIDLVIGYGLMYLLVAVLARRIIIFRWLLARVLTVLMTPNPYLLLKDSIEGKSVGKLLMGLVVYNEKDKCPGGPLDSIIRNWYLAIPFVGPTLLALVMGATILSGRKKRLGDNWADTTVIADHEYQKVR